MALIIALLIFIIVMMILNYLNQKDFVAPVFLGLVSFLLATVLIILNHDNWNLNININFVIIVVIAIFSLMAGSLLIRLKRPKLGFNSEYFHRKESKRFNYNSLFIKKYPQTAVFVVSIILFGMFVYFLLREVGFDGSFSSFLRKIYDSKIATEGGNFLFHQIEKMIIAIAYVNYFHIMNVIFFSKKNKMKRIIISIIPVGLALLVALLSTDRNILIRFFIYALALWIMFFQRSPRRKLYKSNRIILICTAFIFVAMLLVFYSMGKMKQYTSNLERMVGIYGGSGLYNFNLYVDGFNGDYTFGLATFRGLINSLSSLGILSEKLIIPDVEFITFNSNTTNYVYSSNIYSALQPFYQDFGVFGVIIFVFFIGLFLEFLYQKTFKYKYGYCWLMYAAFVYPTVFLSVADQFYARLHLGLIYELFWLTVIFYITYGRYSFRFNKLLHKKKIKKVKIEMKQKEVAL